MFNAQLNELYKSAIANFTSEIKQFMESNRNLMPTHPLLLHLPDEKQYLRADLKVMIFGQETNDWEGPFGQSTVDNLYDCYDGFFHAGDCLKHGGQFWNSYKQYKAAIQENVEPKSVSFLWNNVLKIGKCEAIGTPSEDIIRLQMQNFRVLAGELEILDPDVLLFFTGPRYDRFLEMHFPGASFRPLDGFNQSQLAKIECDGQSRLMLRTYHPGYLYRRGKAYYEKVKDAILNELQHKYI